MTEDERMLAWHERQGNEKAAAYYRERVAAQKARAVSAKGTKGSERARKKRSHQIGKRVV